LWELEVNRLLAISTEYKAELYALEIWQDEWRCKFGDSEYHIVYSFFRRFQAYCSSVLVRTYNKNHGNSFVDVDRNKSYNEKRKSRYRPNPAHFIPERLDGLIRFMMENGTIK
jgi:hypothetical protein